MTRTSAKSVHWSSSCVHIVVAPHHHVGVGGVGTLAHVSCCIVQAEARGLYDVTTNARALRQDARGAFVPRSQRTAR